MLGPLGLGGVASAWTRAVACLCLYSQCVYPDPSSIYKYTCLLNN